MSDITSKFDDVPIPASSSEVSFVDGVPVGRPLTPAQVPLVREALEKFIEWAPEDSHSMVVTGGLGFRENGTRKSTEEDVLDCCYREFGYPKEPLDVTINVILDSGGGSLDAGFKIALFLRGFARDIRLFVPRRAKSASTLIALGANEILMSPFSELGPLDTQIADPRNVTKNVSALDCYRSVDYVQEFGFANLPNALGVLVKGTAGRVPISDLVTPATDFAVAEVVPMLAQVKTLDFGTWGRSLKIGETYAKSLQMRLGNLDYEKTAEDIAKKLVYGYPHHPYPIDHIEAKSIGLNVSMMPQFAYEASLALAEACGGSHCVGFLRDIQGIERSLSLVEKPLPSPPNDGERSSATPEPPPPSDSAVAYVPPGADRSWDPGDGNWGDGGTP